MKIKKLKIKRSKNTKIHCDCGSNLFVLDRFEKDRDITLSCCNCKKDLGDLYTYSNSVLYDMVDSRLDKDTKKIMRKHMLCFIIALLGIYISITGLISHSSNYISDIQFLILTIIGFVLMFIDKIFNLFKKYIKRCNKNV